eukprot:354234-Chlamydomonas_euryale.AAC.6
MQSSKMWSACRLGTGSRTSMDIRSLGFREASYACTAPSSGCPATRHAYASRDSMRVRWAYHVKTPSRAPCASTHAAHVSTRLPHVEVPCA